MMYTETKHEVMTLSGSTMGTRFSVQIPASSGGNLAGLSLDLQEAVDRVDQQMSPWIPGSALNCLNRLDTGRWIHVPRQILEVLFEAMTIETASNGAFSPAVGPSVSYWGFSARNERFDSEPGAPECAASAIEIEIENSAVRKTRPISIDLCGIAKGYGVDELSRVLVSHGFSDHISSIDGEIRCCGSHPNGHGWRVAVEAPDVKKRRAQQYLDCHDLSLATSGGYRNFKRTSDKLITHIINPRTGIPCSGVSTSVSVASENCSTADAWATALQVLGPTDGAKLADRAGVSALFLTSDETVATGAMKNIVQPLEQTLHAV